LGAGKFAIPCCPHYTTKALYSWVFIGGAVCGTVGSIICATAQSIPTFIGGMVIIGVGAATQLSYYYVMGELVPMKYRLHGNAFCYLFAIPAGFGPAVSRAFIDYSPNVGWRGPYYVLIAINALALACWVIFYHPPTFQEKHRGESKSEYAKNFDYMGTVLYTGGAVSRCRITLGFVNGLTPCS
jgi:MFS family permease